MDSSASFRLESRNYRLPDTLPEVSRILEHREGLCNDRNFRNPFPRSVLFRGCASCSSLHANKNAFPLQELPPMSNVCRGERVRFLRFLFETSLFCRFGSFKSLHVPFEQTENTFCWYFTIFKFYEVHMYYFKLSILLYHLILKWIHWY